MPASFSALLFRFLHTQESGRIDLKIDGADVVVGVRRGWVTAVRGAPSPLLRERLSAIARVTGNVDARFTPLPSAEVPSDLNAFSEAVHPGALLRELARATQRWDAARSVASKYAIDNTCLYPHERVLAITLRTARTIGALHAQFSEAVVDRLLGFLAAVDGLIWEPPRAHQAIDADDDAAYLVLGIARGASRGEIRRAFLARAKAVHPDRHPGISADAFIALQNAYRLLTRKS